MADKTPEDERDGTGTAAPSGGKKAVGKKTSREDRLAEALRANLRRRKVAAKTRNNEKE
ncbi:MAG: hypothetical protein HWE23_15195 [Rhodobacteraceae bacterium]|nr:hypothetical protein [Paracoccaceae bacterium]